jgi:hypothetical protein
MIRPRFARHALVALCFVVAVPVAPAAAQDAAPLVVARTPAPPRVAWFARFQDARTGPESLETVTRTFKVGAAGSLDIFNLAGPIVVTGTGGEAIVVTAVKRARGDGDSKGQLDAIVIDVSETAGRVQVRTVARRTKNLRTWVDYTVQVPYGTTVSARTLAGDVTVSAVRGEVQIESASGTVEATDTPRLVRIKTLSGDIRIVDAASLAAMAASTVSGKLVARGITARALDLATISGDLVITNTSCDRAQMRTVSGTLEFHGPLVKGGRYEFTSHAGDVRLTLAGSRGFELSAKSFSGDVHADMALSPSPENPRLPPALERRDIHGTFGDGSALVIVKTFSGSVVVGRADERKKAGKKQ